MADPDVHARPCCTPSPTSSRAVVRSTTAHHPTDEGRCTHGQILVPGGTFQRGDAFAEGYAIDGEAPAHQVSVSAHYIDATAVTNAAFSLFVDATGYMTDAERLGSSAVTAMTLEAPREAVIGQMPGAPWWLLVEGATWRHPQGPHSDLSGLEDHPVVHVTWRDADAFCRWSGTRLPTEAEWEHAARGGMHARRFPWGDDLLVDGLWQCNIWQGDFPSRNTADDGWTTTAPVGAFPANGFGLHEMSGNVWEWCSDYFSSTYYRACAEHAPVHDPQGPGAGSTVVLRGGSFMCHDSYCHRYRVAARSPAAPDSSASNVGFRRANDAEPGAAARPDRLQHGGEHGD